MRQKQTKLLIDLTDDEPDYMFEDMRPSQPGLIDMSGEPCPVLEALKERNAMKGMMQ